MKVPPLLSPEALHDALETLPQWKHQPQRNAIEKHFAFKNFKKAFEWMAKCATIAENMNHHPEWRNVYNKVDVVLTTHSAKGLTSLDIQLALDMDKIQAEQDENDK